MRKHVHVGKQHNYLSQKANYELTSSIMRRGIDGELQMGYDEVIKLIEKAMTSEVMPDIRTFTAA